MSKTPIPEKAPAVTPAVLRLNLNAAYERVTRMLDWPEAPHVQAALGTSAFECHKVGAESIKRMEVGQGRNGVAEAMTQTLNYIAQDLRILRPAAAALWDEIMRMGCTGYPDFPDKYTGWTISHDSDDTCPVHEGT